MREPSIKRSPFSINRIQFAILLCLMPFLTHAEEAQEKLLFGFEQSEVDLILKTKADTLKKRGVPYKKLENGNFLFFRTRPAKVRYEEAESTHEDEIFCIRPMRCVTEQASQGKHACRIKENATKSTFYEHEFRYPKINALPLFLNEPQANLRVPELLNTSGWYDLVIPRDWSGYDLLRIDVRLDTPEVEKLMLEVEDDYVEPPVSITFDPIPQGKWVTLELDLNQAIKDRGLNLTCMNNIWVRAVLKDIEKNVLELEKLIWKNPKAAAKKNFLAYLDNIRLAKKGAPCALPIFKGQRSTYTLKLPRSYAVKAIYRLDDYWPKQPGTAPADKAIPSQAKIKSAPGPLAIEAPSVIPIRSMIAKGCLPGKFKNRAGIGVNNYFNNLHNFARVTTTSARDANHMVVGFFLMQMGTLRANPESNRPGARAGGLAVVTTDGGKTWTGSDGNPWPTVLGGEITHSILRPVDIGGDVGGIYNFGCDGFQGAHIAYPSDRVFFTRTVFSNKGWWTSPKRFVSGESRHCHWVNYGDLVQAPSGRLWSSFEALERGSYEENKLYRPRFHSTYVYYSDDRGNSWQSWRGAGFVGTVPSIGKIKTGGRYVRLAPYRGGVALMVRDGWTWLDPKQNKWTPLAPTGIKPPWRVVSHGEDLYLSGEKGPARWYDGKNRRWLDFSVPSRTGERGRITVCANDTLVFVETDESEKKLLCWRKTKGKDWVGPQELFTEQTKIMKLATPRYTQTNFVPVAYMCLNSKPGAWKKKGTTKFVRKRITPDQDPWEAHSLEPWIKVLKVPAE